MGEIGYSFEQVNEMPLWSIKLAVHGYSKRIIRENINHLDGARYTAWLSTRDMRWLRSPYELLPLPDDVFETIEIVKPQEYWDAVIKAYEN